MPNKKLVETKHEKRKENAMKIDAGKLKKSVTLESLEPGDMFYIDRNDHPRVLVQDPWWITKEEQFKEDFLTLSLITGKLLPLARDTKVFRVNGTLVLEEVVI